MPNNASTKFDGRVRAVGHTTDSQGATLRAILAKNLRQMIDAEGISVRAWALARDLDVRLIDRLTKGEHAVTLDKLEEIASACGLQAWHLLTSHLPPTTPPEPPEPPELAITMEERALIVRLHRLLTDPKG